MSPHENLDYLINYEMKQINAYTQRIAEDRKELRAHKKRLKELKIIEAKQVVSHVIERNKDWGKVA